MTFYKFIYHVLVSPMATQVEIVSHAVPPVLHKFYEELHFLEMGEESVILPHGQ